MTQALANSNQTRTWSQPWLSSAVWDCLLIISPAFISSFIVLALKQQLDNSQHMPLWAWVSFVLVVDVAHVYATLFRTYLDRRSFNQHRSLLVVIPVACFLTGSFLYSVNDMYFWRTLAYLAVFHFIRQQFGFVALYSRNDPLELNKFRWLDQITVYAATLFPLIYWHTHLPRNFNWFVDGDFVQALPASFTEGAFIVYLIIAALYLCKEIVLLAKTGFINVPKNLIVTGTALSWWVGIVALNSDIAFTMTNVLTHGIPYMALIWLYHRKTGAGNGGLEHDTTKKSLLELARNILLSFAPAFVLLGL